MFFNHVLIFWFWWNFLNLQFLSTYNMLSSIQKKAQRLFSWNQLTPFLPSQFPIAIISCTKVHLFNDHFHES